MKQLFSLSHNVIPEQEYERQFMAATGVTLDIARFAMSFIVAVLSGILVRFVTNPTARHLFSAVVGIAVLYYPFGSHIIHGVITSLATYLVMWLMPRKCGTWSWLICFPYLTMLHVANASGVSWNEGDLDFTGGQMVLTLKLISMAMCFQDANSKKDEELTEYQTAHVFKKLPSLLEYLGFVFCFGNLLAGPVIEFRDYQMWANREGPWDSNAKRVPFTGDCISALKALFTSLWAIAFYLTLEKVWNFKLLATSWYFSQPLFIRLCCMQVIGTVYRHRYYFVWSMGHCSLAFAGMDFLKWDDKTGKGTWGRCRNARLLKVEFCDSSRLLAQYWNTATGNFLRRYVYERLTVPGGKATFTTLMMTQLVSGVWHGLYPGYIMFFAGSAIFFAHSTVIYNWERAFMPNWLRNNVIWWAIKVFWTKQGLDFLAMAFLWLTWKECITVWASVNYIPIIGMIAILVLGNVFHVKAPQDLKRSSKAGGAGSSSAAAEAAAAAAAPVAANVKTDGDEAVSGDHLYLGEGIKSALVDSRVGSAEDLVDANGLKQE